MELGGDGVPPVGAKDVMAATTSAGFTKIGSDQGLIRMICHCGE